MGLKFEIEKVYNFFVDPQISPNSSGGALNHCKWVQAWLKYARNMEICNASVVVARNNLSADKIY